MKLYLLLFLIIIHSSFAQKDDVYRNGEQLINENKLDEAISYFQENLNSTTNPNLHVLCYLGIADAQKLKLNYNDANINYNEAYRILNKTKNVQLTFLYHVKMAEFFRKRTLFEEAVKQLGLANNLLNQHRIEDIYLGKFYNRKAALFTEFYMNQDSTLFYANKSREIALKIDDKDNFFYSSLEIANIYDQNKDFKKAISSFEYLIAYAKKNHLVQPLADVYINYTRTLRKDHQIEKALTILFEALDWAKKNDLLFHENIYTIDVYLIYKQRKNLELAIAFMEKRLELSERYYKFEHNKNLFDLEQKYKVAEKEKQIKIDTLEIEKKDKELTATKAKFLLISGLFALAILSVFLISYFLKKIKITNKKLQFLSNQNEFLLSEANHRINNNLQLIIVLISDQISALPDDESDKIKKILNKINSIATLHRHLYQSNEKSSVNSLSYLRDIEVSFNDLFTEHSIKTNFNIESLQLQIDAAMYFGLLLSELCINSIKYAFINQGDKEISFDLHKEDNLLFFNYSDNGKLAIGTHIKPRLIDKLCRQLRIDYIINTSEGFNLSFQTKIK